MITNPGPAAAPGFAKTLTGVREKATVAVATARNGGGGDDNADDHAGGDGTAAASKAEAALPLEQYLNVFSVSPVNLAMNLCNTPRTSLQTSLEVF